MANTKIPSELIDGTLGVAGITSSADGTAITINSSEQIGIGTTNPNARLVVSDSGDSPVRFVSSGQATNYFELTNTGGAAIVFSNNNDLVFGTSNSPTERMRIDGGGSKMISTQGTTIDSNWGTDFQGFQMANTHVAGYANTVLFLGGNNVWNDANYYRSQTGYSSQLVVNDSTGSMVFKGWGTGSAGQLNSPDIRFKVTNDGMVTMPNHPVFDVSTTATGITGDLIFNTVYVNVGSHYSTSNGRFTAPVAGTYLFYTQYIKNASGSVARRRFLKNANVFNGSRQLRLDSVGSYLHGTMIQIVTLAANDYVTVDQYANSAHGGTNYEVFGGYLIG